MREAIFYEVLNDNVIKCNICQRHCLISEGLRGYCSTRLNRCGKLFTLSYGMVSTLSVAPIEKKPLFHFYPGSRWFSLGTFGCNFLCPGCQNWEIAHIKIPECKSEKSSRFIKYVSPKEAIRMAKKEDCIGLSFTYNEPTIWFEYTLDCSKLAKKEGLLTNYVTNGFITKDALDEIGEYLDSFRVDVKGFSKKSYSMIAHIEGFDGIMEVTKRAKHKWDMHIEIITNIIPTFNDDEYQLKGIANWINDELGADTPWHLTRFVPNFKLSHIDYTPIETLEKAREIGFDSGLLYVYLGNVPGHKGENTYCPYCNKLLVERDSYSILRYNIIDGKCPVCKKLITGRWK